MRMLLLHYASNTRLLSSHRPAAQLLHIPPCSHIGQPRASAWQHGRCTVRTSASSAELDAPVQPAGDATQVALQPTAGSAEGGIDAVCLVQADGFDGTSPAVGSEPLQRIPCLTEETQGVIAHTTNGAHAHAQADAQLDVQAGGQTEAQSEAADFDKSAAKAAARKARRVAPTLITPHQHQLSSMSQDQLYQLFSNGALLIDKPLGWTSFDVCGKLRNTLKFLGVKKVGHAGTLDPLASGLLVVATGAGTKFCDDFMALEKEYSGIIRLGEGTDTYDAEGDIKERLPWDHLTDEQIQEAAAGFVGDIQQVPPMYSAIKVKGQKLYQLAREGETIDRQPRPVTITSFKVWRNDSTTLSNTSSSSDAHVTSAASSSTESHRDITPSRNASSKPIVDGVSSATDNGARAYLGVAQAQSVQGSHTGPNRAPDDPAQDVYFHVWCSKGTYIRSLAYDLGQKLGTVAHLAALRRESVGDMRVSDAWDWQELLQQLKAAKENLASQQAAT